MTDDLYPGYKNDSSPQELTAAGDKVFFAANPGSGIQMWATSGEYATQLTFVAGGINSNTQPQDVIANGSELFWQGEDVDNYHGALWKSDGTAAGTTVYYRPTDVHFSDFVVMQGRLYMQGSGNDGSTQLWTTDGTAAGTVPLTSMSGFSFSAPLYVLGSTLYWGGHGTGGTDQLWKSDGTSGGTQQVTNIQLCASGCGLGPRNFGSLNGELFFQGPYDNGSVTAGQWQMWKSDGTGVGTQMVTHVGSSGTMGLEFMNPLAVGNELYFQGWTASGYGLWKTDGTEAGTTQVAATRSGTPTDLTAFNGKLYFSQADAGFWTSDGTPGGTALVNAIWPSSIRTTSHEIYFGGKPYYGGAEQLWVSDGTSSGTGQVTSWTQGWQGGAAPRELTVIGDRVYFAASDDYHGREVFAATTGTAPAPFMSQTIGLGSPVPTSALVQGSMYYVNAYPGASGLPVTVTIDPASASVCTASYGDVSFIGAGTCIVDIDEPGDSTFLPAHLQESIPVTTDSTTTTPPDTTTPTSGSTNAVPAAPTGLTATAGDSYVSLSWRPPFSDGGSPVTGYAVYRSTSTGVLGSLIAMGLASTSFTDTHAVNGTTYVYSVAAMNNNGTGSPSTPVAATPDAGGTTTTSSSSSGDNTPPTVTMAAGGSSLAQLSRSMNVHWGAADVSGIASYDVRYTRAAWNTKPGAPVLWKSATTATSGALTGALGSEYCFSVRARDRAGNVSAWSAPDCLALPLDDRALTASAGWKKLTGKAFYNGTAMAASAKGRTLSVKGALPGHASLVVDEGKGFGSVSVLYNGKAVKTVSLAATSMKNHVVIALPKLTKTTTVVVKTASAKRIEIDGLLLAR